MTENEKECRRIFGEFLDTTNSWLAAIAKIANLNLMEL